MQRPRFLALIAATSAAIALSPTTAAVALAADPTVVVRPGDTLTGIAKRVNVPMSELIRLNALADPNRIYAGQTLRIGADPAATAPTAAVPTLPAPAAAAVHVVQRGENLTWIARQYGVSVDAIVLANGIANASRIYGGQQLVIPGSVPAAAPAAAPPTEAAPVPSTPVPVATQLHVVQRGETLIGIARRYSVSVDAIAAANGIADPSRIYGGQQLTIPSSSAPATPAVPATPSGLSTGSSSSMLALMAQRDGVRQMIVQEAATFGVPASFALAVAWQESGWQQPVVSHAGAVGIMQLMPATAEWVGASMLGTTVDMYDARQNVRAGVQLLAYYLSRYGGSHELVLAAYYQGQRALDLHGIYPVSRPYIASVLALEALFGG
ncbi:MAG TPA: LysM peptidoglycan-binding domain-containing protein [Candidatus Limnocylindria bacterium]|nr:LysM peptidoglycan-binding domain-containing protein [Candidatus Limnocylindria bacterium]